MKIVTDCAADLTPEEISALEISVAPLYIQFPEGEVDATQITPDEFYSRLKAMEPNIPTTAMPAPGKFAEIYQKVSELKDEVLSIHISSGLSGTIDSARQGAAHLAEVVVNFVDTLTLSGGERFQVLVAARALKAGWTKEALLERLHQVQQATEVIYTLDTLTYLARGGRIGRVQALAGSLLHLKPVIRVDRNDGKYSTVSKARTIRKALEEIANHLNNMYDPNTPLWVTVLHGQFAEQAENLTVLLQEKLNVGKLEMQRISPVLGVHTGPGIVGAAVVPLHLMEEIA